MMKIKQKISHRQGKQILSFALMLVFAACFAAFAFVGSAQENSTAVNGAPVSNAASLPRATVRGRIVYDDTEKPLRRIPFSLEGLSGGAFVANANIAYYQSSRGITDANGEFELRNIFAGKYFLRVDAPNVLNEPQMTNSASGNDNDNTAANYVASAQEFDAPPGGAVEVTIRVKRGAAINGRIVYPDGEPAAKVSVAVIAKNSAVIGNRAANTGATMNASVSNVGYYGYLSNSTTTTDDRGVYRISGLPPGEYAVSVTERTSHNATSNNFYSEMASSFLSLFYRDATEISKATTIRLDYGQELADVDFTLAARPLFKVAGKIVARSTKQPVPNARIALSRKTPEAAANAYEPYTQIGDIIADEQGAFKLIDLPAGKYTMTARSPSENAFDDYEDGGQTAKLSFVAADKDFEIAAQDLDDLTIELAPGATLAGKILVEGARPPNYATLAFFNEDERKPGLNGSASFSEEGDDAKPLRSDAPFRIVNAEAGKYSVNVYAGYFSEEDARNPDKAPVPYLKAIRRAGAALNLPLELREGETINDLELILATDGGRVKGIVRRSNQVAELYRLLVVSTDAAKWNNSEYFKPTLTGERGEYEIAGAPGEYYVIGFDEAEARAFEKAQTREAIFALVRERTKNAARVTIRANAAQTINLTVP